MDGNALDAIDKGILHHLQQDGRARYTEIAETVDVSENTVRNRIEKLEERGIITGYTVTVDYPETLVTFVCSAPITVREEIADHALEIDGVVEVLTMMTGKRNVIIKVVGAEHDDITDVARELEQLDGLDIEEEYVVREHHHRPYSDYDINNLNS